MGTKALQQNIQNPKQFPLKPTLKDFLYPKQHDPAAIAEKSVMHALTVRVLSEYSHLIVIFPQWLQDLIIHLNQQGCLTCPKISSLLHSVLFTITL